MKNIAKFCIFAFFSTLSNAQFSQKIEEDTFLFGTEVEIDDFLEELSESEESILSFIKRSPWLQYGLPIRLAGKTLRVAEIKQAVKATLEANKQSYTEYEKPLMKISNERLVELVTEKILDICEPDFKFAHGKLVQFDVKSSTYTFGSLEDLVRLPDSVTRLRQEFYSLEHLFWLHNETVIREQELHSKDNFQTFFQKISMNLANQTGLTALQVHNAILDVAYSQLENSDLTKLKNRANSVFTILLISFSRYDSSVRPLLSHVKYYTYGSM